MKTCSKCRETLTLKNFYTSPRGKNGRVAACISCTRRAQKAYYLANKNKWVEYETNSSEVQKDQARATTRSWHKQHLKTLKETGMPCKYTLRRKYNMSVEQFKDMLDAQNGVCKICGEPEKKASGRYRLSVDHDHTTGTVRGLLCFRCNTVLGKVKDSTRLLLSAIQYLAPFQPQLVARPQQLRYVTSSLSWL